MRDYGCKQLLQNLTRQSRYLLWILRGYATHKKEGACQLL